MKVPGKVVCQEEDLGKLASNEVLICTKACGICKGDVNCFLGKFIS